MVLQGNHSTLRQILHTRACKAPTALPCCNPGPDEIRDFVEPALVGGTIQDKDLVSIPCDLILLLARTGLPSQRQP